MHVDDVKLVILNSSAFFAVSINVLLIVLIVAKSPKHLGSYRYLMIYIAFFESAYAIAYVVEKPEIFTKHSFFLILVNVKTSLFPEVVSILFDLLFVGFYGISLATLAIHFIYRYLTVSNGKLMSSFQNWKLALWLLFPLLNGAIWMFSGGVIFAASEDSNRFVTRFYEPVQSSKVLITDLYYMGPFYYPTDKNENEYVHWRAFFGSAILLMLIFLSFATMAFFGLKGYRKMRTLMKCATLSEKFRSIQAQLFYALVFQTIIPVFLMHIPATVIYVTIFFNCSTEVVGETLGLTIAMYPALNPLPTIFIVKSYKQAVVDFLICVRARLLCRPTSSVSDSQLVVSSSIHSRSIGDAFTTAHVPSEARLV